MDRPCLECGSAPAFFVWSVGGVATYACSARCRVAITQRFITYASLRGAAIRKGPAAAFGTTPTGR